DDVVAEIVDGTLPVNAGSISMTINGVSADVEANKSGNTTTVVRNSDVDNLLANGLNEVTLTYTYTDGGETVTVEDQWSFTVLSYTVVPAANRVEKSQVDEIMTGFTARVHQIDRNPGVDDQGSADRFPGDGNRMPRP